MVYLCLDQPLQWSMQQIATYCNSTPKKLKGLFSIVSMAKVFYVAGFQEGIINGGVFLNCEFDLWNKGNSNLQIQMQLLIITCVVLKVRMFT